MSPEPTHEWQLWGTGHRRPNVGNGPFASTDTKGGNRTFAEIRTDLR